MPETLRRNVEESLQFLSGGRLKAIYIAAEFLGVENIPDRCLKARELSGKIWIPVCCFCKVKQLLADQIVQCVLDAETFANRACGLALLLPNLVKIIHVKPRGGQLYRWVLDISKTGGETRAMVCIHRTGTFFVGD